MIPDGSAIRRSNLDGEGVVVEDMDTQERETRVRRELRRTLRNTVICVVLISVLVLWFLVVGPIRSQLLRGHDVSGAPVLHGKGVVESITHLPGTETSAEPPIYHIRMNGQTVDFQRLVNLQPRQRVTVNYHLGKSGTIYVERVDP